MGRKLTDVGFQEVALKFKVLSDPMRLKVLYLLRESERSVGEIAEALETSQPNGSRYLARLQRTGIIKRRQEGTTVYYSIADPTVFDLCEVVCGSLVQEAKRPDLFQPPATTPSRRTKKA
jgi:DNA-binding transcriptional ArsR family regulator